MRLKMKVAGSSWSLWWLLLCNCAGLLFGAISSVESSNIGQCEPLDSQTQLEFDHEDNLIEELASVSKDTGQVPSLQDDILKNYDATPFWYNLIQAISLASGITPTTEALMHDLVTSSFSSDSLDGSIKKVLTAIKCNENKTDVPANDQMQKQNLEAGDTTTVVVEQEATVGGGGDGGSRGGSAATLEDHRPPTVGGGGDGGSRGGSAATLEDHRPPTVGGGGDGGSRGGSAATLADHRPPTVGGGGDGGSRGGSAATLEDHRPPTIGGGGDGGSRGGSAATLADHRPPTVGGGGDGGSRGGSAATLVDHRPPTVGGGGDGGSRGGSAATLADHRPPTVGGGGDGGSRDGSAATLEDRRSPEPPQFVDAQKWNPWDRVLSALWEREHELSGNDLIGPLPGLRLRRELRDRRRGGGAVADLHQPFFMSEVVPSSLVTRHPSIISVSGCPSGHIQDLRGNCRQIFQYTVNYGGAGSAPFSPLGHPGSGERRHRPWLYAGRRRPSQPGGGSLRDVARESSLFKQSVMQGYVPPFIFSQSAGARNLQNRLGLDSRPRPSLVSNSVDGAAQENIGHVLVPSAVELMKTMPQIVMIGDAGSPFPSNAQPSIPSTVTLSSLPSSSDAQMETGDENQISRGEWNGGGGSSENFDSSKSSRSRDEKRREEEAKEARKANEKYQSTSNSNNDDDD